MTRSAREPRAEGDVDALASALDSLQLRDRLAAAARLREHPGDEAEAALLRALEDESMLVRQAALGSLVALDPERDPAPVVAAVRRRALRNRSMVRVRAADEPVGPDELVWLGLWRLRRLNPVETLLAALAERGADAEAADWLPRADVLRVLGKLGDRRAVNPLVGELGHRHGPSATQPPRRSGRSGTRRASNPWHTRSTTRRGAYADVRPAHSLVSAHRRRSPRFALRPGPAARSIACTRPACSSCDDFGALVHSDDTARNQRRHGRTP